MPRKWELWEGYGYPNEKSNSLVYYIRGAADLEDDEERDNLAKVMHVDGTAPTARLALDLLESAVVLHGQVTDLEGELHCYFGPQYAFDSEEYYITRDATWVEVDEYED